MNIFFLSTKPELAAVYHCDKHVVKMVLETTQMLCTAHRILDGDVAADAMGIYRTAYANHPMTKWVRENQFNYAWTYRLLQALCNEYTHRYNKVHKTQSQGMLDVLRKIPENIYLGTETGRTVPPMCMPDKYKNRFTSDVKFPDVVDAYRRYYIGDKKEFACWTKRNVPEWWPEFHLSEANQELFITEDVCVICYNAFEGYGNNPWPLASEGKCCDTCNVDVLVSRVIGLYAENKLGRIADA